MARSLASGLRAAIVLAALFSPGFAIAADGTLEVIVDRASVVRAPDNTATIVIGNPMIADATNQKNGVLVVTGKSFGSTNIMLLDAAGGVISETIVKVSRAPDGLVVQRGVKRESYSCAPRCEPVLAIGDSQDSFANTAGQISQRGGMSTSQGN